MNINSHARDSKESHGEVKEDVKTNGIKGACQKEFEKEVTEIREGLSKLMELLQRSD